MDQYRIGGRLQGPGLDVWTTAQVTGESAKAAADQAVALIARQHGVDPALCAWFSIDEIQNVSEATRAIQNRAFDPNI